MHHTHCLHTLHFGGKFAKVFPATLSLQLSGKVLPILRRSYVCVCVLACMPTHQCVCVSGRMWHALIAFYWSSHALWPGGCQPGSLSKLFCGQLAFILLEILLPDLPHIRPLNYPQHVCHITNS